MLRALRVGVSVNDFTVIKELGSGAYSTVFLVTKNDNKQQYALKKIDKLKLNQKDGVRIRTERAVML